MILCLYFVGIVKNSFRISDKGNPSFISKIKKIIKYLPHRKAPGHEKITNLMPNKLPPKCVTKMVIIIHSSYNFSYLCLVMNCLKPNTRI